MAGETRVLRYFNGLQPTQTDVPGNHIHPGTLYYLQKGFCGIKHLVNTRFTRRFGTQKQLQFKVGMLTLLSRNTTVPQ